MKVGGCAADCVKLTLSRVVAASYFSGATVNSAACSSSFWRSFGEAVMPSAPVGLYPTEATAVEGALATALLSLSICRALGEAVMPSSPVARYPTEATVVEGVLATACLSFSICRTLGEAAMPSSMVGRNCALAVRVKAPATATVSRIVFFIILSFFVVAAFCRCSFTFFNTPCWTESLKKSDAGEKVEQLPRRARKEAMRKTTEVRGAKAIAPSGALSESRGQPWRQS